jgi:hypothetical protein
LSGCGVSGGGTTQGLLLKNARRAAARAHLEVVDAELVRGEDVVLLHLQRRLLLLFVCWMTVGGACVE